MNKVTIQIPVSSSLKISAEKAAIESGFSSLQEAIRVFMTQFAKKSISIGFLAKTENEILKPEQETMLINQYNESKNDIKKGKGYTAYSLEEIMQQLHS